MTDDEEQASLQQKQNPLVTRFIGRILHSPFLGRRIERHSIAKNTIFPYTKKDSPAKTEEKTPTNVARTGQNRICIKKFITGQQTNANVVVSHLLRMASMLPLPNKATT